MCPDRIQVIVGYKAELITDYFSTHPPSQAQLSYRTQEKQDGTGAAARLAREFVGDSPFLLTFGDILVLSSTYQAMFERLPGKDAVVAVKRVDDPYQGTAVYVEGALVKRMIEKPRKAVRQPLGATPGFTVSAPATPSLTNSSAFRFLRAASMS